MMRRKNISPAEFLTEHLRPSVPAIVAGEMDCWAARHEWTFEKLAQRFGGCNVPVYGEYFGPKDLKRVMPLADFVSRNIVRRASGRTGSSPYVRWFTIFQEVSDSQRKHFPWGNLFFDEVQAEWAHPAFLPTHSYLLPFCSADQTLDFSKNTAAVLAKGLYLSPQGAETRLHKDPWGTDAVICQVQGRKFAKLWAPDMEPILTVPNATSGQLDVFNIHNPDHQRFPGAAGAKPAYEGYLEAGDILYIPAGWYHHVDTVEDSVSITWNFVHMESWPSWYRAQQHLAEWERSDINYVLYGMNNRTSGAVTSVAATAS